MNLTDIQAALDQKTATIHMLQPKEKEGSGANVRATYTVSVKLILEGQPVKALVDTRSPVTIVPIDCLLDVLSKNHKTSQTNEGKRFLAPTLLINNYDGGEVNIISQLTVTLSHGSRECQTTILV